MKCFLCQGPLVRAPLMERRYCIRCGVYMEDIPLATLVAKLRFLELQEFYLLSRLFGDRSC